MGRFETFSFTLSTVSDMCQGLTSSESPSESYRKLSGSNKVPLIFEQIFRATRDQNRLLIYSLPASISSDVYLFNKHLKFSLEYITLKLTIFESKIDKFNSAKKNPPTG